MGDTQFARSEDDLDFLVCGTSVGGNRSAPGIWYTVEGEDFPVQASIFGEYDIQLTVFEGDCNNLVCVDGTEGDAGDFQNGRVIWTAAEGTTYFLFAHGYTRAIGEFEWFLEATTTRDRTSLLIRSFHSSTGEFELFYETAIF